MTPNKLSPLLLLTALVLAAAPAARADGFNGVWRMDIAKPFGVSLRSYIILHQDGTRVSGSVFANSSDKVPDPEPPHGRPGPASSTSTGDGRSAIRPEGRNLHVVITYGGQGRDEATAVPAPESELNPPAQDRAARPSGPSRQRARADAADGLEQLEPFCRAGRRPGGARGRGRHGRAPGWPPRATPTSTSTTPGRRAATRRATSSPTGSFRT